MESRELVGRDCSLPDLQEAAGRQESGKGGCCLWVNAMGHLARTQQLD